MSRITLVISLSGCAGPMDPIWPESAPDPELPQEAPEIPEIAGTSSPITAPHEGPGNVLLFVADDLGIDRLGVYEVGEHLPPTPTIDELAATGVRYTRAWGQSLCSPGRASIMTGRQPYHTLIGHALSSMTTNPLGYEEVTLPELLGDRVASAYFGKWHLSSRRLGDDYFLHPNLQGWGRFSGLMVGLDDEITSDGLPQSYFDWERTVDGVPERSDRYLTTVNADDAIAAIERMPEPWLIEVAFLAPHAPLHWPPDRLWTGAPVGIDPRQQKANAMIEAMDREMGRVIAALGELAPRTTVVFTADNGTEPVAVSAPYDADHAKGTPYEGGLRVPLVVSGYGVERAGEACDHLVQTSDLFATVAELHGVSIEGMDLDSISFAPSLRDPDAPPARTLAFAEQFRPSGPPPYSEHFVALRDDRYKLVRWSVRGSEDTMFFDLQDAAAEGPDLYAAGLEPEQQAAFDALMEQVPTAFP